MSDVLFGSAITAANACFAPTPEFGGTDTTKRSRVIVECCAFSFHSLSLANAKHPRGA
jgi:hypothetical protein